jgi:hypothetical protein
VSVPPPLRVPVVREREPPRDEPRLAVVLRLVFEPLPRLLFAADLAPLDLAELLRAVPPLDFAELFRRVPVPDFFAPALFVDDDFERADVDFFAVVCDEDLPPLLRLVLRPVPPDAPAPIDEPDITRCAASLIASAMIDPSFVALVITELAALLAVSAASIPASLIALRAFGLALIAAAAAASPAASISLLIAALAILSTVVSFDAEDFEEDFEELVRLLDFAIANLPSSASIDTRAEQRFRCGHEKAQLSCGSEQCFSLLQTR